MSCCGGAGAAAVQERGRALVDAAAARGALVKLVYTGDEMRTRAYVAEGRPYFFGVNKPVSAVPARVAPQFLDPQGRYYGTFALFEAAATPESEGASQPIIPPLSAEAGQESASTPVTDTASDETINTTTTTGGRKRGKDAG